jgi:plastocyanin
MRRILFALLAAVLAAGVLAAPSLSAGKSVVVGDNFFGAKNAHPTVTIKKGQAVTWRWTGHNPHNVTVTKGPVKFHSATQSSGSFAHKFTKAGTYNLICTIHGPIMTMKVIVK